MHDIPAHAKTALLIIDMQDAYFKTPRLKKLKPALTAAVNDAVIHARSRGWTVYTIRTVHERDMRTWTRNMRSDRQGFAFRGDTDTELISGLDVADSIDMTKTRDSAFHGTNLYAQLRKQDITEVVLTGVATHSCVFHTAVAAYAYDLAVRLYAPGIGDENVEEAEQALSYLEREYRQSTVDSL